MNVSSEYLAESRGVFISIFSMSRAQVAIWLIIQVNHIDLERSNDLPHPPYRVEVRDMNNEQIQRWKVGVNFPYDPVYNYPFY